MLKKIPVAQLRLGMHLHRLEGRWLEHPFWRSSFPLRDALDLRRVRDSGVAECWIDTSRGLDVEGVAASPGPAPTPAAPAEAPSAGTAAGATLPAATPAPGPTRGFAAEVREAADICLRSRDAVVSMFGEARMGRAIDAEACLPLVDEIASSVMRNPDAIVSLARLKTLDDYTYMHSVAVCALMVALGRRLGLDDDGCREAGLAGLMHDIGKALMPSEILNKPTRLTEPELRLMRTHPERGHELLAGGRAGEAVRDVCLHHHERIDGTGYPHRLPGERITLLARMGAVCDVYDAITSNRPYKAGWDPAHSVARMASWKGHFDEHVFAAFVHSLGIYPTGSLVRLASGQLAVVAEQNPQTLLAPVVRVFYSIDQGLRVAPQRLDLSRPGCADRIVGRESPAAWGFERLEDLWVGPDVLRHV